MEEKQIKKVSEITLNDLYSYCRIDLEDLDIQEKSNFQVYLDVAKKFIKDYTGLNQEEMDSHEDFVIVVYILVEDMNDNRRLYVDKTNLNKVVETILGMHCNNLL